MPSIALLPLMPFAPLLAALCWAAGEDVATRRIRNELTIPLALAGLAQSLLPFGAIGPGEAMLGLAVGLALPFVLFAINALGGGDVKLFAAVGAWVGPYAVFQVFLLAAIVGLVIVLGQAVWQGRLRVLARNSAVLAVNLAHASELGMEHVSATGRSSASVDKPLPYAVPIAVATTLVILGLELNVGL